MSDGDNPRRTAEGYRRGSGRVPDERLKSAAEAAVADGKSAGSEEAVEDWRVRLQQEEAERERTVATAASAATAPTLSGRLPASREPLESPDPESSNKVWYLVAAAIGLCFALGLVLALRPGNEADISVASDEVVEIQMGTSAPPVTAPATTEAPSTSDVPTTAQPITTVAPAALPPAAARQSQGDPGGADSGSPAPTSAPTPANLTVVYPRNAVGHMTLLEGSLAAIVINNSGGQPGGYSVGASGAVILGPGASGMVPPGGSVQVAVTAGTNVVGEPPHATLTVSAGAELLTIEVHIT